LSTFLTDSRAALSADQADPEGLLRAAFAHDRGHAARDILLAWLMSLGPEIDPARAARTMLPQGDRLPGTIGGELAEIACWPSDRLDAYARTRRRRTTWCSG
jgi:hypothetical protein